METLPVILFVLFVGFVLALSFYFARRAKSAAGYYAAGGNIHWSVNGIAFAGDYLSAASFLGICGMIATAGYDGFLYSIGYLAGWIVYWIKGHNANLKAAASLDKTGDLGAADWATTIVTQAQLFF